MTKRLFLAINLPSEIKKIISEVVLKFKKNNKNKPIKWVEEDNFHLTLHFLGNTPEEKIINLNHIIEPIVKKYPALNFKLTDKINAFPDLFNPKIIYLEIKELNDGKTLSLQQEIGKWLKNLGFEIDCRPFHLHLTLGRIKFKTSVQIPKLQIPNAKFQIFTIDLMASNLTSTGPIYEIISKYPLST